MNQNVALVTPGMQFVLATAIWSGSRITPRISPKTSSSGCAASTFGTDAIDCPPESEMTTMGLSSEVTRIHTAFIRM